MFSERIVVKPQKFKCVVMDESDCKPRRSFCNPEYLLPEVFQTDIKIIFDFVRYFELHSIYTFCSFDREELCVKTESKTYFIISNMKIKKIEINNKRKCSEYFFKCSSCFEYFIKSNFKAESIPQVTENYILTKRELELIAYCDCLEDEDSDYLWELLQIEKSSEFYKEDENQEQIFLSFENLLKSYTKNDICYVIEDDSDSLMNQYLRNMLPKLLNRSERNY